MFYSAAPQVLTRTTPVMKPTSYGLPAFSIALMAALLGAAIDVHAAGEAALAPTRPRDGSGPQADLLAVSADALRGNAKYNGALAEYRALKELVPQARGKLLPQLSLFGDYALSDESIDGTYYGVKNIDREDSYKRGAYGATLSQTLINTDQFYGLDQAGLRVQQGGYLLDAAQGELLVNVAESFFALLGAEGNLTLARAKMNDLKQEFDQVSGRASAGLSTKADVKTAEAGYELAVADETQANNAVVGRRARLTAITGEQYGLLKKLPDDVLLEAPQPADEQVWIERTLARNPNVLAKQAALEIARLERDKAQWRRAPKLRLNGRAYALNSDGGIEGARDETDQRISLSLNLPLYSGGQISSEIREAQALYERAQANLQDARAQAVLQTRLAYMNSTDGLRKVLALRRAVEAADAAVDATRGGFEAGTRTYADVLSAVERRYSAHSDYAVARYTFLVDSLRLRQDAGMPLSADLARINRLLVDNTQPAP